MAHTYYRNITGKTESQKSTKPNTTYTYTHTKAVLVHYHYKVVNTAIIFAILMEVSLFKLWPPVFSCLDQPLQCYIWRETNTHTCWKCIETHPRWAMEYTRLEHIHINMLHNEALATPNHYSYMLYGHMCTWSPHLKPSQLIHTWQTKALERHCTVPSAALLVVKHTASIVGAS